MNITIYRPSTGEQIPIDSVAALNGLLEAGNVTYDDYCFCPGATDWKPLRDFQITADGLVPLPPLPAPTPPPPRFQDYSTSGQHNHTFDLGVTVRTKHCVLAYVTFGLGCLSFLFAAFAAIPGAICGHMAMKQCDADTTLLGRPWAKIGLTLCWIMIIANLLVALGAILLYAGIFIFSHSSK